MKANDTQIRMFLEGSKQFTVPLFQREYVWKKKDVEKLWDDIKETETNDNKFKHFFGSFVTMPTPSGASTVMEFIVVDGQQRLTTVFIILATIRERLIELEPEHKNKYEIDDLYLMNQHYPEHKHKFLPTQEDRNIFHKIIEGQPISTNDSNLIFEAYTFFKGKFDKINEIEELDSIKRIILTNFSIVDIALEEGDDPYLIFETLNGTGVPLTQADLVRNFLFMNLEQKYQQDAYDNIWSPLQICIEGDKEIKNKDKRMDNFIRHYLAMDGDVPTFNRVYITFKEIVDNKIETQDDVINVMKELKRFSEYYSKFLYPENEKQSELRVYFEKIKRLDITTAYPLLLKLYSDYEDPNTEFYIEDFVDCLHAIETFVVRRAVCGIPVNALKAYFPKFYASLDQSDKAGSLKETLSTGIGTRIMPDNTQFRRCLRESSASRKVFRYLLEEIERNLRKKEVVNLEDMQIEHIMPQTLTKEWKKDLGDNWELTYKKYIESIGNLTLTGYNPEYSNKSFKEKRDMKYGFKDSGLKLNRHLAQQDKWGDKEINDRFKISCKRSNCYLELLINRCE